MVYTYLQDNIIWCICFGCITVYTWHLIIFMIITMALSVVFWSQNKYLIIVLNSSRI